MKNTTSQIIEGDCLQVMKKIPDHSIDFICSDLPYNISGKSGLTLNSKRGVVPADFGEWDKWDSEEDYFRFVFQVCQEYRRILKPNASLVLFLSYYTGGWIAQELQRRKIFSFRSPLIFAKENPIPRVRKNNFRPSFELAVWMMNNQGTGNYSPRVFNFLSQAEMKNVFSYRIGQDYKKSSHPTEKPEHLVKRLIEVFTDEGDLVLDSFAGGGTTPVACLKSNRRFIAIEKDHRFFQMMKDRVIPQGKVS